MRKMKKLYFKAGIQIAVLVIAIFAFSYLMRESSGLKEGDKIEVVKEMKIGEGGIFYWLAKIVTTFVFSKKGLVSATDGVNIINTCIETNDGQFCKEYLATECNSKCKQPCEPSTASKVAQCKPGTCYDPNEGKCTLRAIRMQCEQAGGQFINDPNGNHQKCRSGCCFYGGRTQFVTEGECQKIGRTLGTDVTFDASIRTEIRCLEQAEIKIEGACVLGKDPETQKNNCVFVPKENCLSFKGAFYENVLCSNPNLNTKCEKQQETRCIEGKDEVYWFDSCGNRENIYDADKAKSWNNGMVLSKDESCSVASGSNLVANQGNCGNCNRLASTTCGNRTSTQRLADSTQEVVCRDLSCVDENGNKRINGEAWCVYQGAIGVVDNLRSVDTPGSRHFLRKCIDGEIITEPCADYRTEICVEAKAEKEDGGMFSTASCRQNLGVMCLSYNNEDSMSERERLCNENPDCFIRSVYVSGRFNFNLCVPKYPLGNDIELGTGAACSMATMTCTAVKVKKPSGWDWKYNRECTTETFAQQMNDVCMSLGDCGAEVNYIGKLTENYEVSKTPRLPEAYLTMLRSYSEPIPGKVAEPGDVNQFYGAIGIPNALGTAGDIEDPIEKIEAVAGITGAAGGFIGLVAHSSPALAGLGGVLAGAAAGFAMTYYIIKYAKIAPGLPPALLYSLLYAGAAGGALIGAYLGGATTLTIIPIIGLIILVIVIIIVVVLRQMHIGKIKTIEVKFICKPWQPPKGGADCKECGKDGFPCSKYACENLGTTCRFLNEGTSQEACEDVAKDDVIAPMIKPWSEKLSEEYEYEEVGDMGVRIKSKATSDGCIPAYTRLQFGLLLNKLGQCRYSQQPNIKYSEMVGSENEEIEDIGGSLNYIYQQNITAVLPVPSLEELGYNRFTTQRAEFNLYIKCENANGYASDRDYVVNICIKPGLDIEKPRIERFEPYLGYVKADATNSSFIVWANEPVNCSWDNEDKDYAAMRNAFECQNTPDIYGWKCDAGTIALPKDDNAFFVRCKDQPFEENESLININDKSEEIHIKKTTPLRITSASPDGETFVSNLEPMSVEVKATTAGGYNGNAICSYSFDNMRYQPFFNTLETSHSQVFDSFTSGNKKIWIKCEDLYVSGNVAEKTIEFKLEIDSTPPVVTRIFAQGNNLVIKTNEPSTCYLSRDKCDFNIVNASKMSGEIEYEHSLPVNKGTIYYVKCKDKFDNIGGACNVAAGIY